MNEFNLNKESYQDTLFDVVVDAGTDSETGLVVAVDLDATGAHVDARDGLLSSPDTLVFIGKISL